MQKLHFAPFIFELNHTQFASSSDQSTQVREQLTLGYTALMTPNDD